MGALGMVLICRFAMLWPQVGSQRPPLYPPSHLPTPARYITNTKAKFLLVVDDPVVRDDELRAVSSASHALSGMRCVLWC